MNRKPYACPECRGNVEVRCYHCGGDMDCEACDGTGLDAEKIDLEAWDRETRRKGMTKELVEDGVYVGRANMNGTEKLYYRDYERK